MSHDMSHCTVTNDSPCPLCIPTCLSAGGAHPKGLPRASRTLLSALAKPGAPAATAAAVATTPESEADAEQRQLQFLTWMCNTLVDSLYPGETGLGADGWILRGWGLWVRQGLGYLGGVEGDGLVWCGQAGSGSSHHGYAYIRMRFQIQSSVESTHGMLRLPKTPCCSVALSARLPHLLLQVPRMSASTLPWS
jgi:hypothetical protein